jgi:hypothetical protein
VIAMFTDDEGKSKSIKGDNVAVSGVLRLSKALSVISELLPSFACLLLYFL